MPVIARMQYDERPVFDSDLSFKGDKGLTKQSDAKDCDINAIFKRYERTGQLPDLIVKDPTYGDFSNVPTYQEACEIVAKADEQFASLDVRLRNRFENDPVKFLEFVTDPKNIDEVEKMGLLKPEAVEARQKARDEAGRKAEADRVAAQEAAKKELIAQIKDELTK